MALSYRSGLFVFRFLLMFIEISGQGCPTTGWVGAVGWHVLED